MTDWEEEALAAGWLPPAKVAQIREELAAAQTCMPSDEALTKVLERIPVEAQDSADLDAIEQGMELQEALEGMRASIRAAQDFLPAVVTSTPIEPVSKPLKPGWKFEPSTEAKPKTTVHVLNAGLALCKFTDKLPRDWPDDQKWAHGVEELRRLRDPEVPCMECVRQDHLNKQRVP